MLIFTLRNVVNKEVLRLYNLRIFNRTNKMGSQAEANTMTDSECTNNILVEGKAKILIPPSKNVFYNPVQEFNRDMSIAVLNLFAQDYSRSSKRRKDKNSPVTQNCETPPAQCGVKSENGITVLEALSATGLRSIRYAKEIAGLKEVVANDINEVAAENIRANVLNNNVSHIVTTSHNDAVLLMYGHRAPWERFDAIDLDPYGCPSQFLDAAVQSVADGGLLLVTSTDMAVLAGNSPETCHSKYGSISLRTKCCHEMALRILLQCIETHANRYGRYIVPLLSMSVDFYIRVFVKIFTGPIVCKRTTSKLSLIYSCCGCGTYTLQPLGAIKQHPEKTNLDKYSLPHAPPISPNCTHCGQKHHMGGPIWNAPIHDMEFVGRLHAVVKSQEFGTQKRMEGILAVISEELPDVPLYYTLDGLSGSIKSNTMSMLQFRSVLLNGNYRVSLSHANPASIKTDAPATFIWDVMRAWEQLHPVVKVRLNEAAKTILGQEKTFNVSFDLRDDANPGSRQMKLVRFQENPQPYWGPGMRSTTNISVEEKRQHARLKQKKRKLINSDESLKKTQKKDSEVTSDT